MVSPLSDHVLKFSFKYVVQHNKIKKNILKMTYLCSGIKKNIVRLNHESIFEFADYGI